jgi:hypothetical protein
MPVDFSIEEQKQRYGRGLTGRINAHLTDRENSEMSKYRLSYWWEFWQV